MAGEEWVNVLLSSREAKKRKEKKEKKLDFGRGMGWGGGLAR